MAKQTVIVSDISGKLLSDDERIRVTLTNGNTAWVLDAAKSELKDLLKVATEQRKRGRKTS